MIADPVAALVALLRADVNVAEMIDARVFGGELPPTETQFMPRGAIVIEASGGVSLMGSSQVEHDTQRVDVVAWGATPAEAATLAATATLAARRVTRQVAAGVLVHWVRPAGGFTSGRDRDTQWPFAATSLQIFHALETVA